MIETFNPELIKALLIFDKEVEPLIFNSTVKYGTTNFKYADLSEVMRIIKPALTKAKLTIKQPTDVVDGTTYLYTYVIHESGSYIQSVMPLPIHNKAQDTGGFMTYFRRYGITSLLGLVGDEDNDAQTESPVTAIEKLNKKITNTTIPKAVPQATFPTIKEVKQEQLIDIPQTTSSYKSNDLKDFIDTLQAWTGNVDDLIAAYNDFVAKHKLSAKQEAWLIKTYERALLKASPDNDKGADYEELPF